MKSTRRGPQRDAMSSLSSTIRPVLHGGELVPAGPGRDGLGVLGAAQGVGQEDHVGVGVHQVLVAELRVAPSAAVGVGGIGHVDEAEQPVHLPDERAAGDRVEGVVELVEVADAGRVGGGRHQLGDLGLHVGHQRGGLVFLPGHRSELLDLEVHVVEHDGGVVGPHLDVQRFEAGDQIGVGLQQHQVGVVRGDGLHVGVPAVEVGYGRLLRVVGELVDGHHLVARADGEHHLGSGRRQRDDPRGGVLFGNRGVVGFLCVRLFGRGGVVGLLLGRRRLGFGHVAGVPVVGRGLGTVGCLRVHRVRSGLGGILGIGLGRCGRGGRRRGRVSRPVVAVVAAGCCQRRERKQGQQELDPQGGSPGRSGGHLCLPSARVRGRAAGGPTARASPYLEGRIVEPAARRSDSSRWPEPSSITVAGQRRVRTGFAACRRVGA